MTNVKQISQEGLSKWKYSFVGGVASLPLTIGYNWFFDPGYYSFGMIAIGGMITGYLATRDSFEVPRLSIGAGLIGALPGLLSALFPFYELASEWIISGEIAQTIVVIPLSMLFLLTIGALLGLLGGSIGGWFATKFQDQKVSQSTAL